MQTTANAPAILSSSSPHVTIDMPPAAAPVAPNARVPVAKSNLEKIWDAVKKVFSVLLAITLYTVNPSLFLSGFLIGIVVSDKISEAVNKIVRVWKKQPWVSTFLLGLASYLALPVTLAVSSFLFAAHFGSQMERNSR